jgi:hypothetical protein
MATSAEQKPQGTSATEAAPSPAAALPPPSRRRQNRRLATVLAGIALCAFVTVISLALVLHYAEAHHLLANL